MKLQLALSLILSTQIGTTVAQPACTVGTTYSVSGPCDIANFMADANGCNVAAAGITADQVFEACEAEAYPFQNISALHYHFDKSFLDGGSHWNTDPEGTETKIQKGRIERIFDSVAEGERISHPTYDSLGPYYMRNVNGNETLKLPNYISNVNLTNRGMPYEDQCEDQTAVCCFSYYPADPNSKICTQDYEHNKRSSHVAHGWGAYADGVPAYCEGYTWRDDDNGLSKSYLGNALFDIAFLNSMRGLYGSVPGTPMCGCTDQMPVITNAACKEVFVDGESSTFTITAEGTIEVTQSVDRVTVKPCFDDSGAPVSLSDKSQYDISKKVLGGEDATCTEATEDIRNDNFWIPGQIEDYPASMNNLYDRYTDVDTSAWEVFAGKGSEMYPIDITKVDEMDVEFRAKTNDLGKQWILYRYCDSCYITHRHAYYRRLTEWPETYQDGEETKTMNSVEYFLNDWMLLNNTVHVDYTIHSTLQDAIDGTNAWNKDCTRQQRTVGFPHNCSPQNAPDSHCQWNTYNRGNQCDHTRYNSYDHAFYLPTAALLDVDFITPAEADRRLRERVLDEPTDEERAKYAEYTAPIVEEDE